MLHDYERNNKDWFAAESDTPEVDRVGDAGEVIYGRLAVLRDRTAGLAATTLAGFQAQAVFLRLDMLNECARKDGMAFDGTSQARLWEFLGEMTKGGEA